MGKRFDFIIASFLHLICMRWAYPQNPASTVDIENNSNEVQSHHGSNTTSAVDLEWVQLPLVTLGVYLTVIIIVLPVHVPLSMHFHYIFMALEFSFTAICHGGHIYPAKVQVCIPSSGASWDFLWSHSIDVNTCDQTSASIYADIGCCLRDWHLYHYLG